MLETKNESASPSSPNFYIHVQTNNLNYLLNYTLDFLSCEYSFAYIICGNPSEKLLSKYIGQVHFLKTSLKIILFFEFIHILKFLSKCPVDRCNILFSYFFCLLHIVQGFLKAFDMKRFITFVIKKNDRFQSFW